jgi:hypothetical protein
MNNNKWGSQLGCIFREITAFYNIPTPLSVSTFGIYYSSLRVNKTEQTLIDSKQETGMRALKLENWYNEIAIWHKYGISCVTKLKTEIGSEAGW